MTGAGERSNPFPSLLAAVLMAAVLVAWCPAVWAVSLLQIGLYALALGAIAMALVNRDRAITFTARNRLYAPLALIALWAPVQLALHSTVYRFETWSSALYWLTDVVAFLLAAQFLQRSRARAQFLTALLCFGFGIVVLSILQSYTSPNHVFWLFESNYRAIGPFVYKNQFAAFVELLMPVALYRMLTDTKNATVYAFLSATMFAAVVASASRAGTTLLVCEVIVVMLAGWRRKLVSPRIAGLLFVQILVMLAACTAVVGWEALGEHFQDSSSGAVRAHLLQSSLQMIHDRPLLGFGLGTWKTVYPAYAVFDDGLFANAAHNDWAQWASEGGIPFALLLFWVMAEAIRLAWRSPWGAGVVFVLIHSFLDYPTREPVVGAILFSLLGAMAAAVVNSTAKGREQRQPVR